MTHAPDIAGWMALLADGYALEVDKDGALWRAAQAQYLNNGLIVVPLAALGNPNWLIYLSSHCCRAAKKHLTRHDCREMFGRIVIKAGGEA